MKELLDLVGNAEGDDLAKLAASVFDPLVLPSSLLNLPLLAEAFLSHHPNMTLHFTPIYSSWVNQVEIWFSKWERQAIA